MKDPSQRLDQHGLNIRHPQPPAGITNRVGDYYQTPPLPADHPDALGYDGLDLYVRPPHRGNGIARTLMNRAHDHAARHGLTRLVLDVLPARTAVLSFYPRLGYTETGPFETESSVPMIYMQRAVTSSDILSRP
jgi:GNAT superfamily N-acetyltransferase